MVLSAYRTGGTVDGDVLARPLVKKTDAGLTASAGPRAASPQAAQRPGSGDQNGSARVPGIFTISLDFELYWGIHDHVTPQACQQRLLNTRKAIPCILDRFAQSNIHATWATVGLLFHANTAQMRASRPAVLPQYQSTALSPYLRDDVVPQQADERQAPTVLARSLIEQIHRTPHQEVGSHTYSHYYCLEPGQSLAAFEADLRQAVAVAAERGIRLESLVFPRNQYTSEHLAVARRVGFRVLRCQQDQWLYKPRNRSGETRLVRALRLLDSYLPLSGSNVIDPAMITHGDMVLLPDSRFLRPYSPRLAVLDGLRLRRIKRSMTQAAQSGGIYHLWWHPHNFGTHLDRNLAQLDELLAHFTDLQQRYGFTSRTMSEIADRTLASAPSTGDSQAQETRMPDLSMAS